MSVRLSAWAVALGVMSCLTSGTVWAGALIHRYSFNDGTANDSVGHANGKLVGAVRILDGQARFDGTAGEVIELPANGPDGINVNTLHAVTVEAWFTVQSEKDWARIFDFGTTAATEGGVGGAQYLFFVPHAGFFDDARAVICDKADRSGEAVISTKPVAPGAETHVALVVDEKTITLYINGAQVGQTPLTTQRLAALGNDKALLGGSLFSADPAFSGSINELRIYNVAADAGQIHSSNEAGPNKVVITQAPSVTSQPHGAAGAHAVGASGTVSSAKPVLRIDASHVVAKVSPLHAGLMTEEINHSYDGGLYGELISNRTFQDEFGMADFSPPDWTIVQEGSAAAVLRVDEKQPLNAVLTSTLRFDAIAASHGNRAGVANDGFWGIPVMPRTRYRASFYAKAAADFSGPVTLSIESTDGATVYAQATVPLSGKGWRQYQVVLNTTDAPSTDKTRFVIFTEKPGTMWLSLVSLFPPSYHDRPNGNRIDLMQRIEGLKPAFLRFPGGNYLEGDSIDTRFDWKKSLGDLSERPTHRGPWRYHSSDGMGLMEFLLWCEDLHMEPVLGVFAGNALQGEFVKPGADLQPYVQDALDEIEYITGNASTPWGARRAKAGHPAPFHLTYVEIGNEDWNPASNYDARFTQFYDAIRAKFPALQLIATTDVKSRTPDVMDEHFYRAAQQFFDDAHHYDRYDRKGPKIFVGEWATLEGEPTPNMHAALGDAAWMTGMERNSDLVIMQAYAPLLANVNHGGYEWRTNLIGYDALKTYGSPSYYAQAMFNSHRGDSVVEASPGVAPGFFYSVTRDTRTGALYIKAVNPTAAPLNVRIELAGITGLGSEGRQLLLTGSPTDTNTLANPEKIIPVESALTGLSRGFEHTFPAFSISVLQLPTH